MCNNVINTSKSIKRSHWRTASKLIAAAILLVDAVYTAVVLYFCYLAILRNYTGSLPYLTTMIGTLQFATGYVLGEYFKKSAKENTTGGITYDSAFSNSSNDATI